VASRAENRGAPALARSQRLGSAVRTALTDYYFNSIRLVAANVVWGAAAVTVAFVGLVWPVGGLLLVPLLALPTAAIFRVASTVVRGRPDAGRADIGWPYRRAVARSLGIGATATVLGLVLGTNVVAGIAQGSPFGWVLATLAAWGLVALWSAALVVWPLVVDPARDGSPLGARLRLAAGLLLVDPVRFGGLGLVVAVIVIVSTVLTAAVLTVSVAFVALLACRMAYPVADRLDPVLAGEGP
jgi:uncharacterized membrane protein YesL